MPKAEFQTKFDGFDCETEISGTRALKKGKTALHEVSFDSVAVEDVLLDVDCSLGDGAVHYIRPDGTEHRTWKVEIPEVVRRQRTTKTQKIGHVDEKCSPKNEHTSYVLGHFRSLYPGAPDHKQKLSLTFKCN